MLLIFSPRVLVDDDLEREIIFTTKTNENSLVLEQKLNLHGVEVLPTERCVILLGQK